MFPTDSYLQQGKGLRNGMFNKRLFDNSLYQFDTPQPSWWEASRDTSISLDAKRLETRESCDVAIIGGGYTGLSCAYHLAKDHSADVRVLEAGHIGWGASGRNGGFCTMGGTALDIKTHIRKYGLDEAKHFYRTQAEAVELVNDILKTEGIDAQHHGDGEMVVAEKPSHYDPLDEECRFMRDKIGVNCEMIDKDTFRENHYDAPHQNGAMIHYPSFGLHPLRYCQGLAQAAERAGAKLHPDSEVVRWYKEGKTHVLETRAGSIRAKQIVVACNGFMPDHLGKLFHGRAMPLQSHIIVTRPLNEDELAAHNWQSRTPAINSRNVYFYYRMLPEKRLMIGGRADFHGTAEGASKTADALQRSIGVLWPHWRAVDIEYSWRGFVCFTRELRPSIGRLPEDTSVYFGFGYHGNGVNNATWSGKQIADWLSKHNDSNNPVPDHLPAIYRGVAPKFPFPGLRTLYARAGVGWHRFKDMID